MTRRTRGPAATRPVDDDDPLTVFSPPGVLWSRANFSEAAPGVLVPASWSFYGRLMEIAGRRGFCDLGVIPRSASGYPDDPRYRYLGVFHGYAAINVNVIRSLMGGLPGTSGDDVERDMLGTVRPGVVDEGFGWRLPAVLAKLPVRLWQIRRGPLRFRAQTGEWWSARVDTGGLRPGVDARVGLQEAMDQFVAAIRWQARGRLFLQAAASLLSSYAVKIGNRQLVASLLVAGSGVEETDVADDLWDVAAGRLDLAIFQARHGFHGPNSGNIESRSWREDPEPVLRLLPSLRVAGSPASRRSSLVRARDDAVETLLGSLTRTERLGARMALRLAPTAATSLEQTKATMLLSLDVARAAIRMIGTELTAAGVLQDREDAFQLFVEELLDPPADLAATVRRRKAARARYQGIVIPDSWEGQPEPTLREACGPRPRVQTVTGLGVGTGLAEGRVRVVLDAGDVGDIASGDVLVCPTTDPSWVALMTVAGGLVIDIGGLVSHGAVVARELGIPCVIGTRTGTVDLRDGDLVRVNGADGTVEVLEPRVEEHRR